MESAAVIEPKASPGESLESEGRREKGSLMLSKVKRKRRRRKIRTAEVLKEEVEEALVLHYF